MKEKIELCIDLEVFQSLAKLREATGRTTGEVIGDALEVYSIILERDKEGVRTASIGANDEVLAVFKPPFLLK